MDDKTSHFAAGTLPADPFRSRRIAGLLFALLFPALITWIYFVVASNYSQGAKQSVYLIVKIVQFAFPAAWTFFALREPLRTSRPTSSGLLMGAVFGISIVLAGLALFHFVLRDLPVFTSAAHEVQIKINSFGVTNAGSYLLLAVFYSLFHSLLEEYYWRWFVFQQARRLMPLWPAVALSAIGFTLHHIIVLSVFFPLWLVVPFSAAIAVGGAFWAWLYARSGSIFDTWLSHLLLDAGIFVIGYELVHHTFTAAG